jgi:hypothetical protein
VGEVSPADCQAGSSVVAATVDNISATRQGALFWRSRPGQPGSSRVGLQPGRAPAWPWLRAAPRRRTARRRLLRCRSCCWLRTVWKPVLRCVDARGCCAGATACAAVGVGVGAAWWAVVLPVAAVVAVVVAVAPAAAPAVWLLLLLLLPPPPPPFAHLAHPQGLSALPSCTNAIWGHTPPTTG